MRWITGVLLVLAAVLKAVELMSEPTALMVTPLGRLVVPIQIGVELGLGLLVLSGFYWTRLRWLSVILFTGFAGYSLYLAMSGAVSCGCFGPLHVHPWWTLILDVAVVVGLVVSSAYAERERIVGSEGDGAQLRRFHAAPRRIIAGAMAVSIIATALLVRYADRRSAVAGELSPTAGGLVILEPEQWIGKTLPIADFVDVNLESGDWIAVLHRHDCPACQEALPRYEQLAATDRNVALIEVPPYGDSESRESACLHGRLKDDREWFVQTPVEFHLLDGVVTAANSHGH